MFTDHTRLYKVQRGADGRLKYFNRAAEDLGVTKQHLYAVLKGERVSRALLERVRSVHPELLGLYNIEGVFA